MVVGVSQSGHRWAQPRLRRHGQQGTARTQVVGGRLPAAAEPPDGTRLERRIRDDVRDGAYVMAFSCVASTATALTVVLLARLAG
ncbi:MAG: hypothetical protein H0U77_11260 [Nocardioidaceae bacterium]|nr:hypothetical protein [Nocardioidaceae bacterium]